MVRKDFLSFSIIGLTLPFFFYKLGQSSLTSWDEAWYADIARHILKTGDFFNLVYNGAPYSDHPPGGFWIMALAFSFFGISEFTVRLSSAVMGFLSLVLVYLIGQKLFNKVIGLSAAVSFASSFWFLFRARSGNLDAPLTFFFLLAFFLALKASEDQKYLAPFCLSLAYLLTIKAMLPFAIFPVVFLIFWRSTVYSRKKILSALLLTTSLFLTWFFIQWIKDPALAYWHLSHGLRESSLENNFTKSFNLYINYLHNGIGKWFWPGVLGLIISIFLKEKRLYLLLIFFVSYSLPFLFSPEVHIWHLIPLHPFLILSFYGAGWIILTKYLKLSFFHYLFPIPFFLVAFYFSFYQLKAAWYQFIDINAYISDEAILSKEAGKFQEPIYIDDDFDPVGTFYAQRPVTKLYDQDIENLFNTQKSFLLITHQWRLENSRIDPSLYSLIKKDRDKVLIRTIVVAP